MKPGTLIQYKPAHHNMRLIQRPRFLKETPSELQKDFFTEVQFDPMHKLYRLAYINQSDTEREFQKRALIVLESFTIRHKIMKNWKETYYKVVDSKNPNMLETFYVSADWVEKLKTGQTYKDDQIELEKEGKKQLADILSKRWGMKK